MTYPSPVKALPNGDWSLPGIANLHSHAFQRAMAGLAEHQTDPADSFWTWREVMYGLAQRFTPELLHAVAAQLYAEMLASGYTHVCEFHYLHHQADGSPHPNAAAMSEALLQAARETGIGITLLPVLYMQGGFDGRALNARQARFGHSVEAYLKLFAHLQRFEGEGVRLGCAFHSLRAVPEAAMQAVLQSLPGDCPIHIHIAEQLPEVEECVALRGARPVAWLLDHAEVDARWTLVHATHLDASEVARVAASGATVAICTTTEGNLGDGLFPFSDYVAAGGAWGVGSDSHISVSPVEELRWLEYGQRLITHRRNVASSAGQPSTGQNLLAATYASSARATGVTENRGLVTLDGDAAVFAGATAANVADRWVFSGNVPLVREVTVSGKPCVVQGRHVDQDAVARRFKAAMKVLLG